jgi:hypothetical protein
MLLSNSTSVFRHGPSGWIQNGKNEGRSRQEGRQRVKRPVIDTRHTTKSEGPTKQSSGRLTPAADFCVSL